MADSVPPRTPLGQKARALSRRRDNIVNSLPAPDVRPVKSDLAISGSTGRRCGVLHANRATYAAPERFDPNLLKESLRRFPIGHIRSVRLVRNAVDITFDVLTSIGRYMVRLGNAERHSKETLEQALSFGSMGRSFSSRSVVTPVRSVGGTYIIPVKEFWPHEYISLTEYVAGHEMPMSINSVTRIEVQEFLKSFIRSAGSIDFAQHEEAGRWRRWTSAEFCRVYDIRKYIIPRVGHRAVGLLTSALATLDEQFREDPRIVHGDLSPRNVIEGPSSTFTLIDLGHVGVGCIDFEIGNWCGAILASCWTTECHDARLASMTSSISAAFNRSEEVVLGMCALRLARGMLMTEQLVNDPGLRLSRATQLRQIIERVSAAVS